MKNENKVFVSVPITQEIIEKLSETEPYFIILEGIYGNRCMDGGAIYRMRKAYPDRITHILLEQPSLPIGKTAEELFLSKYGNKITAVESWVIRFAEEYASQLQPSQVGEITKDAQDLKQIVLDEYAKGNIVISTFEGLATASLKEIIKQPVEGLLYDLNRDQATILTFINDPKWINDYAMMMVVRELKNIVDSPPIVLPSDWISVEERLPEHNQKVASHKEEGGEE